MVTGASSFAETNKEFRKNVFDGEKTQVFKETARNLIQNFESECAKKQALSIGETVNFSSNDEWRLKLIKEVGKDRVDTALAKCQERCAQNIDKDGIAAVTMVQVGPKYKCSITACNADTHMWSKKNQKCEPLPPVHQADSVGLDPNGPHLGQLVPATPNQNHDGKGLSSSKTKVESGPNQSARLIGTNKPKKIGDTVKYPKTHNKTQPVDKAKKEWEDECKKLGFAMVEDDIDGEHILSCSAPLQKPTETDKKDKESEYAGVVIDETTNKPIPNAQIANGCKANSKGQFKCKLPTAKVLVSLPGKYEQKEVELKLNTNNKIKLKPIKSSKPKVTGTDGDDNGNDGDNGVYDGTGDGNKKNNKKPEQTFKGTVVDDKGNPIVGKNIKLLDNCITGKDGKFDCVITTKNPKYNINVDGYMIVNGVLVPGDNKIKLTPIKPNSPRDISGNNGGVGTKPTKEYPITLIGEDGNDIPLSKIDKIETPSGCSYSANKIICPEGVGTPEIKVKLKNGDEQTVQLKDGLGPQTIRFKPTLSNISRPNGTETKPELLDAESDDDGDNGDLGSDRNHESIARIAAPVGELKTQTKKPDVNLDISYKGTVVDDKDNPIVGKNIKLLDNCITGKDGKFDCVITTKNPRYNININGYTPVNDILTPDGENKIILTPSKYKGKIVNDKGEPIEGVEIISGCRSGRNGVFDCPAGNPKSTVTVFHSGYTPETVKLDINADNKIMLKPKNSNDDIDDDNYEDEDYADDDDIKRENLERLQSNRAGDIPAYVDLSLADKNTNCKKRTVAEQIAIIYSTTAGPDKTVKYCKKFDSKKNDPDGKVQQALTWWKETSSEWINITGEGNKEPDFKKQCNNEECKITCTEKDVTTTVNTTPGFSGVVVEKGTLKPLPVAHVSVIINDKINSNLSTAANDTGEFTINSKLPELTADISFIGFAPKRVILKPNPEYNIIEMEPSDETLIEEQVVESGCKTENVDERIAYIRDTAEIGAGKSVKYCKIHKDNEALQSAVVDWKTKNENLIADDETKKMEFDETESEDGQYIIVTCNETDVNVCDDQNPDVQHIIEEITAVELDDNGQATVNYYTKYTTCDNLMSKLSEKCPQGLEADILIDEDNKKIILTCYKRSDENNDDDYNRDINKVIKSFNDVVIKYKEKECKEKLQTDQDEQ